MRPDRGKYVQTWRRLNISGSEPHDFSTDNRLADQTTEPVGLSVKLPFQTPEEFVARYGTHVSRGGIYLRSRTVKAPGTAVTLELKLESGARIIYASALVEFVTGQRGSGISGMGLKFLVLDAA